RWPTRLSGLVVDAPGERWDLIDNALHLGQRAFAGGSSLRRLLIHKRNARNPPVHRGPLTPEQIGRWADRHFQRTGSWPNYHSGPIAEDPEGTWGAVDRALRKGERDLRGGSSLAKFLKTHQASGVGSIPVSGP